MTSIHELLGLRKQPVAIHFLDSQPEGVERITTSAVSGCTYWKLAAEGQTFYTTAEDHYGCPIGAHTHGIELPTKEAEQLQQLVGTMVDLQYISMDEVPQIPKLEKSSPAVVYAPLAGAGPNPDVVIIVGNAKQMMLLAEAVHAAGVKQDGSVVGRPTCAAIPAVIQSGQAATNLGCIGNRIYTNLDDDELYCAFAGTHLGAVAAKLATIVNANKELTAFHEARIAT